eukprot:TRINITY_DN65232_c0_g1_i1.p1 TRINITY_DN65232_c0_g1~~TRINITY_DN65232_c0_g1_i1.p1  ORF type:complete len:713 (+),score=170.42 TRINITY_DN65232_c0_g1_i1:119-2140(+)
MSDGAAQPAAAAPPGAPAAAAGSAPRHADAQSRSAGGSQFKIGSYVIGETLGKGSFGKVKMASHETTGHKVAVKILNRQKIKTSQMDKKIRREIKILKLFRHPHIIRLYEVIETSTDILMVMEYVSGGELFDYIVQRGKLSESSSKRFFQQIVSGIEYCHYYQVVHRDLKPENLLLDGNQNVKIADFGLSNLMRDGDFLKTSCGSPNYAAPEVISGKLYAGPEVDVWSCGVILYALLCGHLPFDEDSIPALFKKIKEGRYAPPQGVSAGAKEMIQKILVVDPMVRITIPQIRDSEWFQDGLAPYLALRPSDMAKDTESGQVDPQVLAAAAQKLGVPEQQIAQELASGKVSDIVVAYNILLDNKKRREVMESAMALGSAPAGGARSYQGRPMTPASLPGFCGLSQSVPAGHGQYFGPSAGLGTRVGDLPSLCSSPVMDSLLRGSGALRKRYNHARFVAPSALGSAVSGPGVSPSSSSPPFRAAFNMAASAPGQSSLFRGSPVGTATSSRPVSMQRSAQEAAASAARSGGASVPVAIPGSGAAGLGTPPPQRAQQQHPSPGMRMTSHEIRESLIDTSFGWRLGLFTEHTSAEVMAEIYSLLEGRALVWKVMAPFHISVRKREHPEGGVKVGLRLYRAQERHDKGYLIDFTRIDGPLMHCLDTISDLYDALRQSLG